METVCKGCEKLRTSPDYREGLSIKYCSQACYYKSPGMQAYFKKQENRVEELKKEIFSKIYDAGKQGKAIDENDPEIQGLLEDLENTHY